MKYHEETEELRFAVIDGMALSGELYGALTMALRQLNAPAKEQNQMQTKYQTLHGTLKRIIRLIDSNVRGMHNAKNETLEIKIEELLQILPADRRKKLLEKVLGKENSLKVE
jgi:hypothetical protein